MGFEDDSDSTYRKYALYVMNDQRCTRVVDYVNASEMDRDVLVLDAVSVKPRPKWLTVVPTLMITESNSVIQGEANVLKELEKARASMLHSVNGNSSMPMAEFCDGLFSLPE